MEIQLMHSNDLFLQFLDWFQTQYPNKQKSIENPAKTKSQPIPPVDCPKLAV
jgi:hypothetical protein